MSIELYNVELIERVNASLCADPSAVAIVESDAASVAIQPDSWRDRGGPDSESFECLARRRVRVTTVVKGANRRKANSHEWCFGEQGLCDTVQPDFVFLTDCGTCFEWRALHLLLMKMQTNAECGVAT